MKHTVTIFCLLAAWPLFSQQHSLDVKYNDLFSTHSLGEHGTVFWEKVGKTLAKTRVRYLSADGKTTWVSKPSTGYYDNTNMGFFADKEGFTLYGAPGISMNLTANELPDLREAK